MNKLKNKSGISEQSMVAHGGESPIRKANASRHVVHAPVQRNKKNKT